MRTLTPRHAYTQNAFASSAAPSSISSAHVEARSWRSAFSGGSGASAPRGRHCCRWKRSGWARCRSCITAIFVGAVASVQAAYQVQDYVPMVFLGSVGQVGDPSNSAPCSRRWWWAARERVDRRARHHEGHQSRSTRWKSSPSIRCAISSCRARHRVHHHAARAHDLRGRARHPRRHVRGQRLSA